MFEFGRDLRRLFEKARDSDDLGWLELIGVNLLETEARRQSVEAGRVSCATPFDSSLRASILWREHARRSGAPYSLNKSESEARCAARHALGEDQSTRALIELAQAGLLAYDLTGGAERLKVTESLIRSLPTARRTGLIFAVESLKARLAMRQAILSNEAKPLQDACTEMERLVQALKGQQGLAETELRLEQAGLSLEVGLNTRDLKRLDQAGRDLRSLVEDSPADQKPLTRARALALCAVGMIALASLADAPSAQQQGRSLFEAASSQFSLDHSPLDWSAIQLMRAQNESLSLDTLMQVQALTEENGLILGAMAQERRISFEINLAETTADLKALSNLETRLKQDLTKKEAPPSPLEWAVSQIALASVYLARARWTGEAPKALGLILIEAASTAQDMGAVALAERARNLISHPQTA